MSKREAREFRKQLILASVSCSRPYANENGKHLSHVEVADIVIKHLIDRGIESQYDEGAEPLR